MSANLASLFFVATWNQKIINNYQLIIEGEEAEEEAPEPRNTFDFDALLGRMRMMNGRADRDDLHIGIKLGDDATFESAMYLVELQRGIGTKGLLHHRCLLVDVPGAIVCGKFHAETTE